MDGEPVERAGTFGADHLKDHPTPIERVNWLRPLNGRQRACSPRWRTRRWRAQQASGVARLRVHLLLALALHVERALALVPVSRPKLGGN
jgi:hypothetical protein